MSYLTGGLEPGDINDRLHCGNLYLWSYLFHANGVWEIIYRGQINLLYFFID